MNDVKPKVIVVGGGTAGVSAVHALSDLKKSFDITLIEQSSTLGAGVRTYFKGGHPYTFGPRHFLTQDEKLFEYLNSKLPLYDCGHHQFITYVENDQQFYNYPINKSDIPRMPDASLILEQLEKKIDITEFVDFEDYWIKSVGPNLYSKFIEKYTKKMWRLKSNKQLDTFKWSPKGVTLSEGDRRAMQKHLSAYPIAIDGYNSYFDKIYDLCEVLHNCKVDQFQFDKNRLLVDGQFLNYDFLLITISPDIPFESEFGPLAYIGRDIETIILPVENAFPPDVFFTYYAGDESYTRIVEYKKFTRHRSSSTLIGIEYPSDNGKHYPLPIRSEMELAARYHSMMPENVRVSGRAGTYRYMVDIDDCIEQGLEFASWVSSGGGESDTGLPVLVDKWVDFV